MFLDCDKTITITVKLKLNYAFASVFVIFTNVKLFQLCQHYLHTNFEELPKHYSQKSKVNKPGHTYKIICQMRILPQERLAIVLCCSVSIESCSFLKLEWGETEKKSDYSDHEEKVMWPYGVKQPENLNT